MKNTDIYIVNGDKTMPPRNAEFFAPTDFVNLAQYMMLGRHNIIADEIIIDFVQSITTVKISKKRYPATDLKNIRLELRKLSLCLRPISHCNGAAGRLLDVMWNED